MIPIIILIEKCKPDEIVELLDKGIADFITPPLKSFDILPRLWRLLEYKRKNKDLVDRFKEEIGMKHLIGESPSFIKEIKKIPFIASYDVSVMITGETGTGKEMCARSIHYLSRRSSMPFIPVNCGSIPIELIENELFGHIKGAFTGASESYSGLIISANGGTLFLDEIDCLSLSAQTKLLRFLQDKKYRLLGSSKLYDANIRIITASNIDLDKAVMEGQFRRDLFYRLNIVHLTLPPLRERKEDIPLLANHFLERYSFEFQKLVTGFSSNAMQRLLAHEWPGNIRELENIVQCAIIFSKGKVIQSDEIVLPHLKSCFHQESLREAKSRIVAKFEKRYIQELLFLNKGNITEAAKTAQKNRRAFWELIRKYNIDVKDFKQQPL